MWSSVMRILTQKAYTQFLFTLYKRTRTIPFWMHLLLGTLSYLLYSWYCTAIFFMWWDFYNTYILLKRIMEFYQNIPGIKKKSKNKKKGLMFWNMSLNIFRKSLSVELLSALTLVKKCLNNKLFTKHVYVTTSVTHCA